MKTINNLYTLKLTINRCEIINSRLALKEGFKVKITMFLTYSRKLPSPKNAVQIEMKRINTVSAHISEIFLNQLQVKARRNFNV